MSLRFELPTPLEYFATLVQSDSHFPLLESALSLAQDEYPDLDSQAVLAEIDDLLVRLKRRIPADAAPMVRLRALNRYFFTDLGFGGNVNDYYAANNSYLNVVLRTRRGIPISLAVLWLELAHGVNLAASGVSFPGHFMLKVPLPQGQVIMDPCTGRSLSREDLSERLEPYLQRHGLIGEFEVPLGLYLQAASGRDIVARMLRNLKEIHRSQGDNDRLLAVLNRLIVLLPQAWTEYRDRGLIHDRIGQSQQALQDFEIYVANADDAVDADLIEQHVQRLRRARS